MAHLGCGVSQRPGNNIPTGEFEKFNIVSTGLMQTKAFGFEGSALRLCS